MQQFKDDTPQSRLLRVLKMLIERPKSYTVNELSERLGVREKTIKRIFETLKNADFQVNFDKNYRYYIENNNQYEHLKDLLFFSERDQNFILDALAKMSADDKYKSRIQRKMETIYDFTRLSNHLLSGQFMNKINLLEKAKNEQKVVVLQDYHSTNSSTVSDKIVEPFHILPNEDILHAFDVQNKSVKHYRISRIKGVELTEEDWNPNHYRPVMPTDPFRISNPKQVRVKMKLKTGGYNELIERFPTTYGYLKPTVDDKGFYLLDCFVNQDFTGLLNFILGNYMHVVEILEPETLIERVNEEAKKIKF